MTMIILLIISWIIWLGWLSFSFFVIIGFIGFLFYRTHEEEYPVQDLELVIISVASKSVKPKNKHPAKPPKLNEHELNELVKQIETICRTTKSGWNYSRFGSIQSSFIREIIWKHKIGFICEYCLVDFRGRYCCPEHSLYYRTINGCMYGSQQPWDDGEGNSIDHIKPISMGGLEFDRDNLQWMDLAENIRKGGINRIKSQQRKCIITQLQVAFIQAQFLYKALGFGQRSIKRYLKDE